MSVMENVEIERKFLVREIPSHIIQQRGVRIDQGFLNTDKERVTRIRTTSDGEAFLTVKGISKGATRVEIETPIDYEKAKAMLTMIEGSLISKIRRKVEHAGKIWELDEFLGDNKGLFVVEIELKSESECFDIPPWVGLEVTDDNRYANSSLATCPMKNGVAPRNKPMAKRAVS